ncbi:MAG: hypothetical protein IKU29_01575 [Parabacteroides sp.]|nr:hypothetical protein [Parabacteroides sp.]
MGIFTRLPGVTPSPEDEYVYNENIIFMDKTITASGSSREEVMEKINEQINAIVEKYGWEEIIKRKIKEYEEEIDKTEDELYSHMNNEIRSFVSLVKRNREEIGKLKEQLKELEKKNKEEE